MNRWRWWLTSILLLPTVATAQIPDGGLPRTGDQLLYTTFRSPRGDVFVYSAGEIVSIHTETADDKLCSAWMPDGERIVYAATSNRQESVQRLFMMNADGSDNHPLMPEEIEATHTSWLYPSPDGARILWGVGVSDTVVWYIVDLATGDWFVLEDAFYIPSWSSDGAKLALSRREGIEILDVTTQESVLIVEDMIDPVWSPDGERIVVRDYDPDSHLSNIMLVNPDGTNLVEVFPASAVIIEVAWNPDGESLVVRIADPDAEPFTGDYFLILVDVATGEYRYLTNAPINPVAPSWSPDGTQLAFYAFTPGSLGYDLTVMDVGAGTTKIVTEDVLFCDAPIWRPAAPS